MTGSVRMRVEISEKIQEMVTLDNNSGLNLEKTCAVLSISTGFKEETIKEIIKTMEKAGRLSIHEGMILGF